MIRNEIYNNLELKLWETIKSQRREIHEQLDELIGKSVWNPIRDRICYQIQYELGRER